METYKKVCQAGLHSSYTKDTNIPEWIDVELNFSQIYKAYGKQQKGRQIQV